MTRQTKHYIDLSEITHFRFDCKKCGATLSLPMQDTRALVLNACPSCGVPWTQRPGTAYDKVILGFRTALQEVQHIIADDYPHPLEFMIVLEVKPPDS
jgi:hypothetical protein